jgi:Arc/MetJ-type ribon-helix-helix transcriptional regulator
MSDTDKVSFNLSVVDLGKVDVLIDQGFYSSRTDFMVTAVRNQLAPHTINITEAVAKSSMAVGVHTVGRKTLEKVQAKRQQMDINVVGLFALAKDVTPGLARATIRSVKVRGAFRASSEVKEALKDRMQ